MNRPELYQKTRKKLLDAYRSGELKHGKCTACAVGNICNNESSWSYLFSTYNYGVEFKKVDLEDNSILILGTLEYGRESKRNAIRLVEKTGYSIDELMKIEYAFESSISNDYKLLSKTKKGQYIGLQAVFKVLDEIHEVDLPSSEEVQKELDSIAIGFGIEIIEA